MLLCRGMDSEDVPVTHVLKKLTHKITWWREQPPNLDEIFRDLQKKLKGKPGPEHDGVYRIHHKKSGGDDFGAPFKLIALILLVLWAVSGIVIVQHLSAVVLRLGQYHRTLEPGPHWIPRIFETYRKENVQRIQEFSYGSEMLTSDENIVYVSLSVQYRIDIPEIFV